MVAVGEILLNAFFQVLFDRLASSDLLNFVRRLGGGVDSELKKWERKLKMIQAVLYDAEQKQLTDEAVKLWLDDLQDLAYDAEDILDEFATQALESKLRADNQNSRGQAFSFIPASLNPNAMMFNYSMGFKIEDIGSRLEQLFNERIELGLQRIPGGTSSSTAAHLQERPSSSSVPTECAVFGRKKDKARILEMVLTDTSNDSNFVVIPIVGMGGIGKTTLAREVYNEKAVEDSKFDVKAWVCVSDVFDVLSISKALLESITRKPCHLSTLNEVQVELKMAVDAKRFLLVLDDVWNEDYSLWVDLKAPFLAAAPNSKMIVTTRHSNVASTMGPIDHYNVKHLSDNDCWSIFIQHAFENRDGNNYQSSQSFRKKVNSKCGGLPLAAKTLGGLLRTTRCDMWESILQSKIWDLPQQRGILPVLKLSYHHLPSHLKRCFAYCAIFPKNCEFNERKVVNLWMAGGIIRQSRNCERLKDWGSKCFRDLVSRSIFQQSSSSKRKFVMHDIVHDLAQLISGETIFRLEEANALSRRFERVRHSSYVRDMNDGKNKFEVFSEIENTRTFLPVYLRGGTPTGYITSTLLYDLLPKFKKLRALSLKGYNIHELPISFENLRLLKYLNLADTEIRSLPESTSSLVNLEILILQNCFRLIKLPSNMRNLINLLRLNIKGANLLKEMPFGMKDLKNLQELSNFIVGKGESVSGLEDLKFLKGLHGKLCIAGLENVNDSRKAREAALCGKQNIEVLSLEWHSQGEVVEENALEVLDILQPHSCIKELTIKNYSGARFPLWLANPLFSKMKVLKLENFENCVYLPLLGLLSSLTCLFVKGVKKLKNIGSEVYGEGFSKSFQSLEILSFENLPEWELWDTNVNGNVEIFPHLHKLSIIECPKLSGKLPELLPSLRSLVVSKCGKLVVSFSSYPMLCRLEVDKCEGLVCRTPIDSKLIKSMTISNSSLNIKARKGMLYDSQTDSSVYKTLTISNVLEFGKLFKEGFPRIDTLAIGNSEWIESRKFRGFIPEQGLIMLAHPGEISIEENSTSLVSFPELSIFSHNLRALVIEKSTTLKSLPDEMMGNNSRLKSLYIEDCNSLKFIARRKLPSSLKVLCIRNCKNLQLLIDGEEDASSSSSLPSSVSLKKLEAVEFLHIRNCPTLESLPNGLQNLNYLRIEGCHSFVSFPKRGLPKTISFVFIGWCEKLEALPNNMHKLNSLKSLSIQVCPSVVAFPEEGIPTNLTSLVIGHVKIYKKLIQWGLRRLTSLRHLSIIGCYRAKLFPDKEMGLMLPTSLTDLRLSNMSKLKYLSSVGFQSITSLEELVITNCPNLTFSLEVGLPSSLLKLCIQSCPMLKQKCKRDNGKEWSKIAHIPCIMIDGKSIYDPDSEE